MPTRPEFPGRLAVGAWGVVGLLWGATLFRDLDRNVLATMRGPILADVPMTEAQFGLVAAAFMWVYGAASPVCGFLADRFGPRRIICASVLAWSAATWLTGQMHSFSGLFWVRAAMGMSEACYLPAALTLITAFHFRTRARAIAVHNTGIYAGAAVGGLGGYIAGAFGWRHAYDLLGILGVAYAVVLLAFLREAPEAASTPRPGAARQAGEAWRALSRLPGFWSVAAINALLGVGSSIVVTWLPTFFHEQFRLGAGSAGVASLSSLQAGYFISAIFGATWSDRWSRVNPRARALVPAFGFCVAAPGLLLISLSPSLGLALVGLGCYTAARGFFDMSAMPILRELVDPGQVATAYGLVNLIGSITGGFMVTLSGLLRDERIGLPLALQASAAALLAGAFLLFKLRSRQPGHPGQPLLRPL